jgi:membrane dipeptidase
MNDLGMIVDVSHISDDAFRDVLETTRVPVMASHSSCRALCRHPRNLTDDMLRALAANGGLCMINFFSAFISDALSEVLRNAQKRPKKTDADGLGGTEEVPDDRADWDAFLQWFQDLGGPEATLDQVANHVLHAAEVAGVEHVGIGSDFDGVPALPTGLTSASMLPSLTARLLERGMEADEVEMVLGGNFLRVFDQVEKARGQGAVATPQLPTV